MSSRNDPTQLLSAGTPAPKFSLKATPDQTVSLDDFKGRPVVLVFYPADWSPVCGDELALFNQILPEFRKYNAQLLGISVDSAWCHLAYSQNRSLHFPLLADFHPKGAVAEKYGAYLRDNGEAARALYVIDGQGIIRWSYLSPLGISPGADGILNALEELPNGETAPMPKSNENKRARQKTSPSKSKRKRQRVTA